MAISLDASTPTFSSTPGGTNIGNAHTTAGAITQVSASFSPPAGSLVLVQVVASYGAAQTFAATGLSVADSASTAYTAGVQLPAVSENGGSGFSGLGMFTHYYATAPGSITVTATLAAAEVATTGTSVDILVQVLDGAGPVQTGAATATAAPATGAAAEVTITTTTYGSWVYLLNVNGVAAGYTAAANTTTVDTVAGDSEGNSPAWGRATNATTTPGAVTLGWSSTEGSSEAGIIALEILPGIVQDASAPAEVKLLNSTSATAATASFSPPANSLVAIMVSLGYDTNTTTSPTVTVADSLSNSYTAGPTAYDGGATGCYIFQHYYATAPGSITVTATRAGQLGAASYYVKTWVLDGAAQAQTGAASASTHAQTGTSLTDSVTPTQLNSWVLVGTGQGSTQAMTASGLTQDTQFNNTSDGVSAATGHQPSLALTSETLGWTVAAAPFWSWVGWEILQGGPAPATVPPPSTVAAQTSRTWEERWQPSRSGRRLIFSPYFPSVVAVSDTDASGVTADGGEQVTQQSFNLGTALPSKTWQNRFRPYRHWLITPYTQPSAYADSDASGPEVDAGEAITATLSSSDASGAAADNGSVAATLSDTDASTGTDSGSVTATLSDSDASTGTESGSVTASLSDTDASGPETDAGEQVQQINLGFSSGAALVSRTWLERFRPARRWLQVPYTQPSAYADSDSSGPEADAGESIVASLASSDTSSGTDSGTTIGLAADDASGTGADAGEAVAATLASQDSSGSSDTGTTVGLGAAESGSGTDSGSVAVTLSSSDASSGTDNGSVAATLASSDVSGPETDAGEAIAATLSSADASGATADGGEAEQRLDFDLGTALVSKTWLERFKPLRKTQTPAFYPAVSPVVTDTDASGPEADAGEAVAATLSSADASGSTDQGTTVGLGAGDTSSGSDSGTVAAALSSSDASGAAADSGAVSLSSADASLGEDAEFDPLASADAVTGTDSGTVAAYVSGAFLTQELSTSTDAGESLTGTFVPNDTESGHGTESGYLASAAFASADAVHGFDQDAGNAFPAASADASGATADAGESIAKNVPVTDTDAGHGTDAGEHVAVVVQAAEAGHGTDGGEALSGTFLVASSDASASTDSGYLASASFSSADASQAFDAESRVFGPNAAPSSSDASASAEAAVVDVYAYQPPFRWTGGGFELRPQFPVPAAPAPQLLRTATSAEPALRVQVEITAADG